MIAIFSSASEALVSRSCTCRRSAATSSRWSLTYCRSALLELLEHRVRPADLILSRIDLRDRVALAYLNACELANELVLRGPRPCELLAERLHLPDALAGVRREGAALLD